MTWRYVHYTCIIPATVVTLTDAQCPVVMCSPANVDTFPPPPEGGIWIFAVEHFMMGEWEVWDESWQVSSSAQLQLF